MFFKIGKPDTIALYKPVNLCSTCENGFSKKTVSEDNTYYSTHCYLFKREWEKYFYVISQPVVECSRYYMIQSK